MRDYGIVSPKFWTEGTGKRLRGDSDSQLVAMYLMTSPHATATGVFNLPKLYIAHEIGISMEGASKALSRLTDEGFCTYDEPSEVIFVHRLAAIQIAEQLKPDDKRVPWLRKEVEKMPAGLLKQRFLEVYGAAFHIQRTEPLSSPIEAPSKPGSGSGSGSGSITGTQGDARSNFELIKTAYPKFSGRQDWVTAEHFCHQRIERDGCTWNNLLDASKRYRTYCDGGGVSSDQYVMTPAKFFSAADKPWSQEWPLPTATTKSPAKPNHDAEWLEAKSRAKAINFRDPDPMESASVYATAVKMAENAKPVVPIAQRLGLAGIKRISA